MNTGWGLGIYVLGAILGVSLLSQRTFSLPLRVRGTLEFARMPERSVQSFQDGAYQFCTQPDPETWLDGAGVCLNFVKQGDSVDGYYGYPHSNHYVCLRGTFEEDVLSGKGLIVIWSQEEPDFPDVALTWGPERRLSLSYGSIVDQEPLNGDMLNWIVFEQAQLKIRGMYLYDRPRMTPAASICDWR